MVRVVLIRYRNNGAAKVNTVIQKEILEEDERTQRAQGVDAWGIHSDSLHFRV